MMGRYRVSNRLFFASSIFILVRMALVLLHKSSIPTMPILGLASRDHRVLDSLLGQCRVPESWEVAPSVIGGSALVSSVFKSTAVYLSLTLRIQAYNGNAIFLIVEVYYSGRCLCSSQPDTSSPRPRLHLCIIAGQAHHLFRHVNVSLC